MVFLTYKKTEKNCFAIECHIDTKVSAILATLIQCISPSLRQQP